MPPKVDIWMPLYIGDYLGDTAHLDAERSGAYLHLLMHYWKRGPLPDDIPATITIARLKGSDAPSIAQALLKEFFTKNGDGYWHQKRQDIEIAKWQDKSLKAQEKAKTAAGARWGKDATSIPPSSTLSTPQALHTQSPSPTPSPTPLSLTPPEPLEEKTKKQKTSKPKPEKPVDKRRLDFIEDLALHWKGFAKTKFVFDGADGTQTDLFLKAWPDLTREQWRNCLRNRRNSPGVIPTQRIYLWISRLGEYLNSPLNEYKQPVNGDGGLNAGLLNGKGGHNLVLSQGFDREEEYSGRTLENGDVQRS